MDFLRLMEEHVKWTAETFPKATAEGSLLKANEEIKEVKHATDFYEYVTLGDVAFKQNLAREVVDVMMCMLDFAQREGISPKILQHEFAEKLAINKGREWQENGDGSYSHIKRPEPVKDEN